MAVQKSRKTPSRRGMRRAHDALTGPTLSVDTTTGETHRRHHVTERRRCAELIFQGGSLDAGKRLIHGLGARG